MRPNAVTLLPAAHEDAMLKSLSSFRLLNRNNAEVCPRARRGQGIARLAIAAALALAIMTHGSVLFAADDIQQIRVGAEIIYVPKSWIGFDSVFAETKGASEAKLPQPGIVDVAHLTMRPNVQWRPFDFAGLPTFVLINYTPAPPPGSKNVLSEQYKQLLNRAKSLPADRYGFVRIATGFTKPGEPPQWERFLYKDYQDKFGEPLIVFSSNLKGVHSSAGVRVGDDMSVGYLFNSDEFPESTWWDLYKRVLAFIEYLQTPK
jgi:hypothetical protein